MFILLLLCKYILESAEETNMDISFGDSSVNQCQTITQNNSAPEKPQQYVLIYE